MSLSNEQPPDDVPFDLREFLGRRFIDVGIELRKASKFPERHEMPYKPQFGDIHYFGDPSTHSYDAQITRNGWYGWEEKIPATDPRTGFWARLNILEEATENFVYAGYGGILQSTPVGISDMGVGFQVLPADQGAVTVPRNITQNIVNESLAVDEIGIYTVGINVAISHNELNASREFEVQIWNFTESAVLRQFTVGVGRNIAVTNWGFTGLSELDSSFLTDELQIRIGGGDTFSFVTLEDYNFFLTHSSNIQSL